jgi:signal transduction histidine kinase
LIRVVLSVFPSHDATGAIDGVTELVHDVTESRSTRARQERLLRAERAYRKEADRLRQAREELTATLFHELRNPLQALLWWSTLLGRLPLDHPDFRKGLDAIMRNVREQARVIERRLESAASLDAEGASSVSRPASS